MASKSRANFAFTSGRNTFTATSRPSVVTAKCTCAIEAAATGTSSKLANSVASGAPKSASITARAALAGNGGSRSCSSARSAVT